MDLIITYNDESHHITINDTTIIDSYIQQEDKGIYIKHLLKTGYAVNSCITPITTTCGCCDKIDQLTTAMEPFNSNGNSSRNGQLSPCPNNVVGWSRTSKKAQMFPTYRDRQNQSSKASFTCFVHLLKALSKSGEM